MQRVSLCLSNSPCRAFMAGILHQISWELAQDVPSFQQFAVGDMLLAQQLFEENLYVNGTGTGQAQGLIGNTGAGVTGVVVGSDNYASELLAATFDVQSALKTAYHQNAGWLMSEGHLHGHQEAAVTDQPLHSGMDT